MSQHEKHGPDADAADLYSGELPVDADLGDDDETATATEGDSNE